MDNDLIRSSYLLEVSELKLIYTALAKLDSLKEIEPRTAIYITKNDFVTLGSTAKNAIRDVRYACEKLMKRTLTIQTEIGELHTHWMHHIWILKSEELSELIDNIDEVRPHLRPNIPHQKMVLDTLNELIESDDNIIARIVFHDDILQFLSALKTHFTQLRLNDLKDLSTFYSHRFYHLMMQFSSTGYLKIPLQDLRNILMLNDKYTEAKDLRRSVIDPAIKEINDKTNYCVEHKFIKTLRKFTDLEITFTKKKL